MEHKRITVYFSNGEERTLVVDYADEMVVVKVIDGIAHFGRTEADDVWFELLAAPLASIQHWG
jgi:hypothetical protein